VYITGENNHNRKREIEREKGERFGSLKSPFLISY
jgi:hypothetical protein